MTEENKSLLLRFREELDPFLEIKKTDRLWHIPLLASLCSGIPLLTGYFLDRINYGILASLAGLVILYLPSDNLLNRMTTMIACSFGFMLSFAVGVCFSFNPYISVIAFTILAFITNWTINYFALKPPGNFFFIMIASIASCLPFVKTTIPRSVGLVGLGTLLACVLALIYSLITIKKYSLQNSIPVVRKNNVHNSIESAIAALFLGGALLISHLLKLENPYWVPVSCLAVMQGLNFRQVWQRSIHRISGTFIGLGLTWLLLLFKLTPLSICISIFLLQFVVEMLIVRHYGLAVIFMTPLTIFLAEAGKAMSIDPAVLISARFGDIVLGCMIGAAGGWFLYHEKLRENAENLWKKWDDVF